MRADWAMYYAANGNRDDLLERIRESFRAHNRAMARHYIALVRRLDQLMKGQG